MIVDASPTKKFFVTHLTRDLSLEDAILDLVDNSIDAYIRTRGIDISPNLLKHSGKKQEPKPQPDITLSVSDKELCIIDRCGGIDMEHAKDSVFRFGRPDGSYDSSLGVYGIGLKRAIFKVGRSISITSTTLSSGFTVDIDVDEWLEKKEWNFELTPTSPATSAEDAGTSIRITNLNPEVALRINDGTLLTRVDAFLAYTYSLFLQNFLEIQLNDHAISARPLPLAESSTLPVAFSELVFEDVSTEIIAGLAQRTGKEWNSDAAGWYVICNGRIVVRADKTELTGWGLSGPRFVSTFRGFLGIAFFFSKDPANLPWTTTKRGLNVESRVFQLARKEMSNLAKPVIDFLRSMYSEEPTESLEARALVDDLAAVGMEQVVKRGPSTFAPALPTTKKVKTTTRVQYDAENADIDLIRKRLSKPNWAAGAVGRHTFDYFLKMECSE